MKLEDFTKHNLSFVIIKNEKIIFRSKSSGLKPLIFCLKRRKKDLKNAIIFDKIVGRAAALLLVFGGVKKVLTPIISNDAIRIFLKNKIEVEFGKKVKNILNREGSDLCPMEKLSQGKNVEEFLNYYNQLICHSGGSRNPD